MQPPDSTTPNNPPAQYEFDAGQNKTIAELASAMLWVGSALRVLGLFYALAAVVGVFHVYQKPDTLGSALGLGLAALLTLSLGRWTTQAADSFQKIVSTSGSDISHLMEALKNLRSKYDLMSFFVKLYVALLVVGLVIGLIMLVVRLFV